MRFNNIRSKNESPNFKYTQSQSSLYSENEDKDGSASKVTNSRRKIMKNVPSLKKMVTISKNLK